MVTVHKYPLRVGAGQWVEMPRGAEILSAGLQGSTMCVWARVNTENPMERREILIRGTGHLAPEEAKFISHVRDGQFEWFVFAG